MPFRMTSPDRRQVLRAGGVAALGLALPPAAARASDGPADHTVRIAPVSHEIAPGRIIRTTAYNGAVPGPALRLKEGKPVRINVVNDSGYPNLVHWHGLYLPPDQDGATEEGSPIIEPGQSLVYAFTPKPSGTRWYHSHAWRWRT